MMIFSDEIRTAISVIALIVSLYIALLFTAVVARV